MERVTIRGWQVGFRKVAMTKLFQIRLGWGLAAAKRATDGILDGVAISVQFGSPEEAMEFVEESRSLGAIVEYGNREGAV